jgi:hypothetical protein
MQQNNLDTLAAQFVELKVPFADAEYKKELAKDVRLKIDDTINTVLLSYMDESQLESYNSLLEDDSSTEDQFLEFYNKCNINLNTIMGEALTRFRIAYLGA